MAHFRPIALSNVVKIITKIIANRLKPVMSSLVGETQCSFILGRQGIDNVVIVQEIIHSMRRKQGNKGWLAAKLDLAKAYDREEWSFLERVLRVIGFSLKLIQLIMWCVSSTNLSILRNGQKVDSLKPEGGL